MKLGCVHLLEGTDRRLVQGILALALTWGALGAMGAETPPASPERTGQGGATSPIPLVRAHSHNDYEHRRPLFDALDHGFCSIEADVHLVDGQLLVAHDRNKTSPERTLATLYLDPLRERARKHGGRVYPGGPVCLLFIDLKTEAESTYAALHRLLAGYPGFVTRFDGTRVTTNAVTVIVSGNRPVATITAQKTRFAALDGRAPDLDADVSPLLVPVVSDRWGAFFKWRGAGAIPTEELARLNEFVAKAKARGHKLRWWAAPDNPTAWQVLFDAGVDLINTDNHSGLRDFLVSRQRDGARAGLYDEDPLDSMPIRERQWKQMLAYLERMERTGTETDAAPVSATGSFRDREDTTALRSTLHRRIGYPPPGLLKGVEVRLDQIGEDDAATYYRCYVPVTAEMEAYGLYIVPRLAKTPVPLVIAQHGGGGFPELAAFRGGANYRDLVRGPVAQGWAVFAPHHIFHPYRDRDHGTPVPANVREQLDDRLRNRGTSLAAVEVAKISRALDALLKRPEVDSRRVAMAGLSYGGFYTLYTAALDSRIRAAVVSCAFAEWGTPTNAPATPAEFRPGGRLCDLSVVDLARLICPRPLQVQAGMRDDLFPIEPTQALAEEAERCYETGSPPHQFEFAPFDGGHEFSGELAWPFLKRHFEP